MFKEARFNYGCRFSMRALPFTIVFLVPLSVVVGTLLGGWFNLLTPVSVFVVVPMIDLAVGADTRNPSPAEEPELEPRNSFRAITMACAPVTIGLVIWTTWRVSLGSMSWWAICLLALSVGINTGIMGINASHELQHRVNLKLEPRLARFILFFCLYAHWKVEHVIGHHALVATPEDPATAKRGQGYYRFWFQTVAGTARSAWRIERARLKRTTRYRVKWVHNRVLQDSFIEILLVAGVLYFFGWVPALFFVGQAFIAFSLLEIINYIEHYGLLRERLPDGTYEPVRPVHSWNSSNRVTNYFLFNLQRHSDHHFKPSRRYQLLRHFDEAPQLPTSYAGMVLVALVPSLFKRIMAKKFVPALHS
jgi:alkane 1-monooxygenase